MHLKEIITGDASGAEGVCICMRKCDSNQSLDDPNIPVSGEQRGTRVIKAGSRAISNM